MSKLKIEHGASKVNLVLLKANIEAGISSDIDLMAAWSDNERKYIVNELLRFALTQEEDFLKYKAAIATNAARADNSSKPTPIAPKTVAATAGKAEPTTTNTAIHA